jgi:type VI secretion system secreted protein Hcp
MAMYMKIEGIEGESKQKDHQKWLDVRSITAGFSNMGGGMPSSSGGRSGGEGVCSEITVTLPGCSALPTITQYCLTGTTVKEIQIQSVTASKGQVVYSDWTLTDCAFSNISLSETGEGASNMGVSLSISYTKFTFKFTPISDAGEPGSSVQLKYDVAQNAVE